MIIIIDRFIQNFSVFVCVPDICTDFCQKVYAAWMYKYSKVLYKVNSIVNTIFSLPCSFYPTNSKFTQPVYTFRLYLHSHKFAKLIPFFLNCCMSPYRLDYIFIHQIINLLNALLFHPLGCTLLPSIITFKIIWFR